MWRLGHFVRRTRDRSFATSNAQTGSQFTLLGLAELGDTNGAAYVQWPDGRHGVLTRTRYPLQHLSRTAEILELVRAAGVPAPRYELITTVGDWTVVVQERLPGAPPPGHIDLSMMEAIVSLSDAFEDLLVDRDDVPTLGERIAAQAADTSGHASLERYDDRSRGLLARIRQIHEHSDGWTSGHDLVHRDFGPANILFDETGQLTGIVDWHDYTMLRGDRRYSLIPQRFEIAWGLVRGWATADPAAVRHLDEALDAIEPATLRHYWAHNSLSILNGQIQRGRHTDVDHLLTIAWSRLES